MVWSDLTDLSCRTLKAKCRMDGMGLDWLSYTAVTPRASLQSDANNNSSPQQLNWMQSHRQPAAFLPTADAKRSTQCTRASLKFELSRASTRASLSRASRWSKRKGVFRPIAIGRQKPSSRMHHSHSRRQTLLKLFAISVFLLFCSLLHLIPDWFRLILH